MCFFFCNPLFISIFAEKCIKYGKIAYISIAKMEGKP